MARQARTVIPGQAMHVMVRGNNRETIFFTDEDRRMYLDWLREAAKQFACAVHAFALMPNHVHLLLTPQNEDSLSKTMQSLGRRYAQYFNQKQNRSGTIWEGRYRSSLIDPDYFLRCQRYIELNPVRAGFESSPQKAAQLLQLILRQARRAQVVECDCEPSAIANPSKLFSISFLGELTR